MNNKEINEKIERMNDELNKLSTKIKDSTDTMVIKSMYAKDELDEKIKEARKNLDETKKVLKEKSENGKKVFSSHLSKIEENIEEAKQKFEIKKEARDKEKLEKYIDNKLEYTSSCIALSLAAIDEAKLSFLEALEAQSEYDELYK